MGKVYLLPVNKQKVNMHELAKKMQDMRPGEVVVLEKAEMLMWEQRIEIEVPDRPVGVVCEHPVRGGG